jgi:hypothetical protein
MNLPDFQNTRTPQASLERWRRAVERIMQWNKEVRVPELRVYINATSVKEIYGGRGTEIKKYLETRQEEIEAHHNTYGLRPAINYGRTNIRERVLGETGSHLVAEGEKKER